MKKLAVLISNAGTGSNLQAIIDAIKNRKLYAKIVVVISDKDKALGLLHAKRNNIPTEIVPAKEKLFNVLDKYKPDYICLAGWKLVVTDEVLNAYPNRILNMHPGLIPDTVDGIVKNPDGTDALWNRKMFTTIAIANFLDKHATYAGSSIHFLRHTVDFGPILGRTFEKIEPNDTLDALYTRLKKKENQLYIEVLQKLCS